MGDPRELVTFLESGLISFMATRAPDLTPECVLVSGPRIDARGERMTVWVTEQFSARTLANLCDNGQAAVTVSRPTDHRSMQLKGTFLGAEPGDERDRAYLATLDERRDRALAVTGMPRSVSARVILWPCFAVHLAVRDVFEQTPGPRAGHAVGRP